MRRGPWWARVRLVIAAAGIVVSAGVAAAQAPALRIVVVEGEDAVNIIQQKTAVAPVVEVRDRNDQPVAGALVRFAIRGGKATFNGSRALTVTTNAAGRAVATSLTPTGTGAVQITATASFQGQTAALTITQTNVLTATQAVGASSAGAGAGSGASAAGGAGGTVGGGISATTIGIIGGAVAGGTLVATKAAGGNDPAAKAYTGTFSGLVVMVFGGGCTRNEQHTGTVRMDLQVSDSGAVAGEASVTETDTVVAITAGCTSGPQLNSVSTGACCDPAPRVSGTTANLTFSASQSGLESSVWSFSFAGGLIASEITGSLTISVRVGSGGGSGSFPVILR